MEKDDVESLSLEEFIQRYPLPETGCVQSTCTVPITSGSGTSVELHAGDVILLRSVTVDGVKLSYYDDNFYRRDTRIAGNFPGKFVVLTPYLESTGESSVEPVTYDCIEDLVEDCPPYFKATVHHADYGNKFSAGDRFRFVKLYRNGRGKCIVECKHMDGRQMHLPHDTFGRFQPLADTHYYTVGELANLAPVARRLKIAEDSINKMCMTDVIPRGIHGDFYMHEPDFIVHVSYWDNLTEIFNLPLKSTMQLSLVTVNNGDNSNTLYDTMRYALPQFASTYENCLPVECRLESYPDIPRCLQSDLEIKSHVCVHSYERIEKILAKSSDNVHYVLSRRLEAKYRFLPRTFTNVSQLLKCIIGTKLKVLEYASCSVPKPISLQPGDLIKIVTQLTGISTTKRSWNRRRPVEQIPVLKCEILNKNGNFEVIKLPLDLEVNFLEILPSDKHSSFAFQTLFDQKPDLPVDLEIVQVVGSELPFICKLSVRAFIRDPCLIVSVESARGSKSGSRINYNARDSITTSHRNRTKFFEIPDRHRAALSYVDSLHSAQLTYPRYDEISDVPVEKVSRKTFSDMENEDMSYQMIDLMPNPSMMSKSKREKHRQRSMLSLGRVSKSLTSLVSRPSKKSACGNHSANVTTTAGESQRISSHDDTREVDTTDVKKYNDDGVYEDVIIQPMRKALSSEAITEPSLPLDTPASHKKSNMKAIFKRLSRRR